MWEPALETLEREGLERLALERMRRTLERVALKPAGSAAFAGRTWCASRTGAVCPS